jgi:hypothetical protein
VQRLSVTVETDEMGLNVSVGKPRNNRIERSDG